jgi:hypothetical protein
MPDRLLVLSLLGTLGGCVGTIGGVAEAPGPQQGGDVVADLGSPQRGGFVPPARELATVSRLRRLTAHEYDSALRDLLGDQAPGSAALLPDDGRTPFDNDASLQIPSKALVESTEFLAQRAVTRLLADTARRDRVIGCRPTGPADLACLRAFVTGFGRRALRRALTADDVQQLVDVAAVARDAGDAYAGVQTILLAFLQDPEFLYRAEAGAPVAGVPGLFKLGGFELATRLSYLLWDTIPDDALLARAQDGRLESPADVRATAATMLSDPRARDAVQRFHALWLGYDDLPASQALSAAMLAETNALVDRVVFREQRPWQDLFRSKETFANDVLATHYGLPSPGPQTPAWVPYGGSGRRGLLSHGSVLANGAKDGDTSPVLRGKFVRERLFCRPVSPPPPDINVDVNLKSADEQPPCKWDRYANHRKQPQCFACHQYLDPVGFGLESYDGQGRYRATQSWKKDATGDWQLVAAGTAGATRCDVAGAGELVGIGTFRGPAELGDLGLGAGLITESVITQLHRWAAGRSQLDDADTQLVSLYTKRAAGGADFRFDELLLDYVASPAFAHRREER